MVLVCSILIHAESTTKALAEQQIAEGYHRSSFTLTNETLIVVEAFIIMDASFNFTLFVACNSTTGFLLVNITQEPASTSLISLGGGTNATRSFLSGGFEVSLYSNGTSLGYYWYDAHIQGGWQPLPIVLFAGGIAILVTILCIDYVYYRRRERI